MKVGSEEQLITRIPSQKPFWLPKKEDKELISVLKIKKRWVNWNTEVLEWGKIEGEKYKKYQQELEILKMETEENE
jgi:hypothetical protein